VLRVGASMAVRNRGNGGVPAAAAAAASPAAMDPPGTVLERGEGELSGCSRKNVTEFIPRAGVGLSSAVFCCPLGFNGVNYVCDRISRLSEHEGIYIRFA
jgi:hypothetical protein